jgi:hypothetical protein
MAGDERRELAAGEIISHAEMCQVEGGMLQRGMTFRQPPLRGVILMSQRPNAPYIDTVSDDGVILYEGHDIERTAENPEPKQIDQPRYRRSGAPHENGKFANWTDRFKQHEVPPAVFHVYEKLKDGIWAFRGAFSLRDYHLEQMGDRRVFKFHLHAVTEASITGPEPMAASGHELQTRLIPTWVKQFVYKRDKGRCVLCGSTQQIHFDHDLPYSRGGNSATPANVRLLCARHNLQKGPRIE